MPRRALALLLVGAAGCLGHARKTPTTPTARGPIVDMEPLKVTASVKDGKVQSDAYDSKTLFEDATEACNDGDFTKAEATSARIYQEFPSSAYAIAARYNSALSQESQEKWPEALKGYQDLLSLSPDYLPGRFRLAHCLSHLDRY